jgi:predicted DCC family thiol-disulfide oxidoreductase YuxK
MQQEPPLEIYYDGACPLCRREIGHYQRLEACGPVRWVDVAAADTALPDGVTREGALARFHARLPDGRLVSGAGAFIELWAQMPGWRWLARVLRVPPLPWVAERAYRGFLIVRPWVQRRFATR